jgi:hypothetical protein
MKPAASSSSDIVSEGEPREYMHSSIRIVDPYCGLDVDAIERVWMAQSKIP